MVVVGAAVGRATAAGWAVAVMGEVTAGVKEARLVARQAEAPAGRRAVPLVVQRAGHKAGAPEGPLVERAARARQAEGPKAVRQGEQREAQRVVVLPQAVPRRAEVKGQPEALPAVRLQAGQRADPQAAPWALRLAVRPVAQ